MNSLLNSMSLVLDEFYSHLSVVGVSSMTGEGIDGFFKAVDAKVTEFERDYRPELERRRADRVKQKEERRESELGRLMRDMNVGGSSAGDRTGEVGEKVDQGGSLSDMEDEEDDDDDDEKMAGGDDDDEDEAGTQGNGLQDRYKRALNGGVAGPSSQDLSFERYLRATKIG